ncbi:uncharacterized protein DMAD_00225 [Drosophila madeirensis]
MDALYSEEQNNSAAAAAPLPTPVVKKKLEVETPKKRNSISIADYWKRKNGGVAAQSQSLATSGNNRDPRKRVGEGSIYWGVEIQTKPKKKSEPKAAKPLENWFKTTEELLRVLSDDTDDLVETGGGTAPDEYQYDTSCMDALYSEEQNNSAAAAAPLPTPVVKKKLEVETPKKRNSIWIADYRKRKNGGVAAQSPESQSLATSENHRDPRKRVGEGSIYWGVEIQTKPKKKSEPKAAKPLENWFKTTEELLRVLSDDTDDLGETGGGTAPDEYQYDTPFMDALYSEEQNNSAAAAAPLPTPVVKKKLEVETPKKRNSISIADYRKRKNGGVAAQSPESQSLATSENHRDPRKRVGEGSIYWGVEIQTKPKKKSEPKAAKPLENWFKTTDELLRVLSDDTDDLGETGGGTAPDEYQYDTSLMDALYSEEQNNSAAAAAPLPTPVVKKKLEVETPKKRNSISIADYRKRKNGGVAAQSQSLATSENHRDPRKRVGEGSIYWGVEIQTKPKKKSEPKAAKPLENWFKTTEELLRVLSDDTDDLGETGGGTAPDEYQYDTPFMDALYSEEQNNSAAAAAPLPTPVVKKKLEVETPKKRNSISIADYRKRKNGGVAAQSPESQRLATSENHRDPRKRVGEGSIYWGVEIQSKPKKKSEPKAAKPLENWFKTTDELLRVLSDDTDDLGETGGGRAQDGPDAVGNGGRQ